MVFQCLLVVGSFTAGHFGFSSLSLSCRALPWAPLRVSWHTRASVGLQQWSADVLCKRPDSKYLRLESHMVSAAASQLCWCLHKQLLRRHGYREACLRPDKAFSQQQDLASACGLRPPPPLSRRCHNTGRASVSPGSVEAVLTCSLRGTRVPVFTHLCSQSR